jgi:hypothetical protein
MWIKRPGAQVQREPCGIPARTINKTPRCAIVESTNWENPARITCKGSIQIWLRFVNGLLSFKISERIVAALPDPLMNL